MPSLKVCCCWPVIMTQGWTPVWKKNLGLMTHTKNANHMGEFSTRGRAFIASLLLLQLLPQCHDFYTPSLPGIIQQKATIPPSCPVCATMAFSDLLMKSDIRYCLNPGIMFTEFPACLLSLLQASLWCLSLWKTISATKGARNLL